MKSCLSLFTSYTNYIGGIVHDSQYLKILELHGEGIGLRDIVASTGNSRLKVTDTIQLDEKKGLVCPFKYCGTKAPFLAGNSSMRAEAAPPINLEFNSYT